MTNIKNKKVNKTKEKIILVAEKLFSKYNYNAVSLNEIAKKVDISKASLYHYFVNKEALYLEILEKAHNNLLEKILKIVEEKIDAKEKIKKILKTAIEFKLNNKSFSGLLMQKVSRKDKKIIEFTNNLKDKLNEKLDPLFQEINCKIDCTENDRKLAIFLVMAQIHAYILNKEYLSEKNNWTVDQVVNQITYSLFK